MVARFSRKGRFTRFPRFRRFRRNRGVWFPVLGNGWNADEGDYRSASFSGATPTVPDSRGDGPTQNVFPLTRDITQFVNTSTDLDVSLRDIVEGQEWKLNRLVGQLHVDVSERNTTVQNTSWPLVEISAGIFVARTGDFDQTLPDLTFDEVDPLQARNAQNSWVWRRNWILSRPLASNVGFSAVPCSNGWLAEPSGPYIDTKVKRRIGREQRLWFIIGAMGWEGVTTQMTPDSGIEQPFVRFNLDLRIHGQMVRAKGRGTF